VFTVSSWTGSGNMDGSSGTDQIVVLRDTDMTLTNTSLAAASFGTLTLASIETASLSGGDAANVIRADAFTLGGDAGDDILIGGSSSLSSNVAALNAIMAEWTSANSYATRVANLLNGGGANGSTKLNSLTIQNDASAADRLTGGSEIDLFFQSSGDVLVDFNAGVGELKTAI
ncbi:MAG TPA: hypothetical protein VK137_09060, partial [Planctomycetaceae bacterium]|nr:hypothetical protein [Planctomycetaceae bacterium]